MNAVQIMTGSGGWPLHVVCLPDGRPFWGGTYFKRTDWMDTLQKLSLLYQHQPEKVLTYAKKLEQGLHTVNLVEKQPITELQLSTLTKAVTDWSEHFDNLYGGMKGAPKFMMPVNYQFLLQYGHLLEDATIKEHVHLTLKRMAWGGVYDLLSGGFSRYSVDNKWHIPHFEKMLYDNAQLISLYSNAFKTNSDPLYNDIVKQTISFIESEWKSNEELFFSSFDADSLNKNNNLEEGAYYGWTQEELKDLLKDDYALFSEVYNVNAFGHWEDGHYVFIQKKSNHEIAEEYDLNIVTLSNKLNNCKNLLRQALKKRLKPRLDDKILTSWNALLVKAYVDAYTSFQEESYKNRAIKTMQALLDLLLDDSYQLWHTYKSGQKRLYGTLEDYACTIEALLSVYEITFNDYWLLTAKALTDHTLDSFYDPKSGMFTYNSIKTNTLIINPIDKTDNVIPSANSIMGHNLLALSHHFNTEYYHKVAKQMLLNMEKDSITFPYSHANWLSLYLKLCIPFYEIAICGDDLDQMARPLWKSYLPQVLLSGTNKESNLPLLANRFFDNRRVYYLCRDNSCQLPTENIQEVLTKFTTLKN